MLHQLLLKIISKRLDNVNIYLKFLISNNNLKFKNNRIKNLMWLSSLDNLKKPFNLKSSMFIEYKDNSSKCNIPNNYQIIEQYKFITKSKSKLHEMNSILYSRELIIKNITIRSKEIVKEIIFTTFYNNIINCIPRYLIEYFTIKKNDTFHLNLRDVFPTFFDYEYDCDWFLKINTNIETYLEFDIIKIIPDNQLNIYRNNYYKTILTYDDTYFFNFSKQNIDIFLKNYNLYYGCLIYTDISNPIKNVSIIDTDTDIDVILLKLNGKYALINKNNSLINKNNALIYFIPVGNYNYHDIIDLSYYKNKFINGNNLKLSIKFVYKSNNLDFVVTYLELNQLLLSGGYSQLRFTH